MTMLEDPPIATAIVKPIPVGYYEVGAAPTPPPTLAELVAMSKIDKKAWYAKEIGYDNDLAPSMFRGVEVTRVLPPDRAVADVLLRTRKVIKRGWMKGAMYSSGNRCLLGALHYVILGTDELLDGMTPEQGRMYYACLQRLDSAVNVMHFDGGHARHYARMIYHWNDAATRTKREVMRMLKREAKALR